MTPVGNNRDYPYGLTGNYSGSTLIALLGPGSCNIETGTPGVCDVIPYVWNATLVHGSTAASYYGTPSTTHLAAMYSTNIPMSIVPNNAYSIWFVDNNGNVTPLNSIISSTSMPHLGFPVGVFANYGWYPMGALTS